MRGIFTAAAALLLAIAQSSDAHSVKRNPLNYVTRLDSPVLHTPSHRRNEEVQRTNHRVFKGHAFVQYPGHSEWINSGFARITISRDGPNPLFQGVFRINGDHHHVVTASNYRRARVDGDPDVDIADDEYMVVWRDTDVLQDPVYSHNELKRGLGFGGSTCESDSLQFNNQDTHPVHLGLDIRNTSSVETSALLGRQIDGTTGGNGAGVNLASTIGSTAGCPSTRKVALIGIATDCNYRSQFGSESDMREHVINMVNSASQVYESTFNISLGVRNITVQPPECPGSAPANAPWNVRCGGGVDITDRLSLFSAWRGQFEDDNAYWTLLSTCNTDAAVGLAWLGQVCSQGATQQGDNETIAAANVVISTDGTEWQVFAHETGHTFGAFHDSSAATASSSKASSVIAAEKRGAAVTVAVILCQFASNGTVCRQSSGACDPAETCSGNTAMCPEDVKTPDGQACGDSGAGLTCASGQCTSRDQQCQALIGSLTSNQDTRACDAQSGSCIVACSSPELGPRACYNMQQYFLDGTPCDGGGSCRNGVCQGSSWFQRAIGAIRDNLNIVIPVACVVGGLILISIFSCCVSSCRRRSRIRNAKARVAQPNSSWVAGNSGGGAWASNNVPYPPPPAYSAAGARGFPPSNGPWMPRRAPTTRYA
ncbi:hypothetical protein DL766_006980 [Monosporascus sp. MC13-8B]|uniref:Peptidase M12B domain-containing protein n=1 Tax=Monosporascus cannonballus TaxID=155416 RepID=A0ABY0GUB3_9PEZI|nr:hypothetical protein DL762_009073 [Monosporascus cannonballus]RYO82941.1 hypothetical protein DL763_008063 [Monosporascus cannonballus]RYP25584.1 hypothetical protein DL766_006980 [Monosporascus sp. MC13-8B]